MIAVKFDRTVTTPTFNPEYSTTIEGRFRSWADAIEHAANLAAQYDGAVDGRVYAESEQTGYVQGEYTLYRDDEPVPPRNLGGGISRPAITTAESLASVNPAHYELLGIEVPAVTHERLTLTMGQLRRGDWIPATSGAGAAWWFVWWATDSHMSISSTGDQRTRTSRLYGIGDFSRPGVTTPATFEIYRAL